MSLFTKAVDPQTGVPVYSWEDYVYREGQLLAAKMSDGTVKHFDLDHLGSPRLETDGDGVVIARHEYWPYGEETTTASTAERMKFTGHERDLGVLGSNVDDMDYMHARYYRPLLGRFLTMDRFGANSGGSQGWNRYSYVLSNPMALTDPTGYFGEFLLLPAALAWANAFTFSDTIDVSSSEGATFDFWSGIWGLRALGRGIGAEIVSGESKDPFFRANRFYERAPPAGADGG